MKYISADKLKTEIDNLESFSCIGEVQDGFYSAISRINDIIDSLQQEQLEIDLEKEVINYFEGYWPGMETAEQCNTHMQFNPPAIMRLVRHFYELGLNARKEK